MVPCVVVKELSPEAICGSGKTHIINCNGLRDVNYILQTLKPKEKVCKLCCAYLEAASKNLINALKRS